MSNTNKRFLIVTRAFYPANSPRANRATELAKELSRQGHEVTVLTGAAEAQAGIANEYRIRFIDLGGPTWREVPLRWWGKSNLIFRAVRRLLLIAFCYPDIEYAWRVHRRLPVDGAFDCVISIAAPHAVHWGMAWSISRGRKPANIWIADCGDPFMGQENDTYSPAFYFRWVEKLFCRHADWITVPTEGAKEGYYPEFRDKLVVIPQGFRFEDYERLRGSLPERDEPNFAYAGHIIPGFRDLGELLQHLREHDAPFKFHIYTKSVDAIRPYSTADSRIVLHEFVPRDVLLGELASMDFLVNIENAGSKQTPSKLIDYWLCGRPILNIRSFDVDTETVDQFLAGEYRQSLKIDNPEQYRIENVVTRFVGLLQHPE